MDDTPERKQVLVVQGKPLTRFAIVTLINLHPVLCVCGEAGDAPLARQLCEMRKPDLVVLDLAIPRGDGIELLRDLHKLRPAARALVVTDSDDPLLVQRALRAGARAVISMREEPTEILAGLESVLQGARFTSRRISHLLLEAIAEGSNSRKFQWEVAGLSDRELQIFRMIGRGFGATAIARDLGRSVKTVETHMARIKEKLGVHGRRGVQERAAEWVAQHEDRDQSESTGIRHARKAAMSAPTPATGLKAKAFGLRGPS